MTSRVRLNTFAAQCSTKMRHFTDGGWLKSHPIPSDKGSFGNFEALSQENKRVIQQILSEDSSSVYASAGVVDDHEDPYDTLVLEKLRGLYQSCMNEDLLDARGPDPLVRVIRNVRRLFNDKGSAMSDKHIEISVPSNTEEPKGLTAALAYLHSRGWCTRISVDAETDVDAAGIEGLFEIEIDGDVGEDPNLMTLWFSQPSLGLPAKVGFNAIVLTED